ncbi:MAG TPA: hypothetical protein DHW02_17890, partial [Ktedonobacter sp.]|nr:hypothetical protein [Ktedonobacter sp.]
MLLDFAMPCVSSIANKKQEGKIMLLITGATGYIGRHLVARLVSQGERPRCLVRDISKAKAILSVDKVDLV